MPTSRMPTTTLATPRTLLVPFGDDDLAPLLALFREPDVRGFLLDGVVVTTEWMAAEIEASQRRFAHFGTGMWSVRRSGEPAIVGFAGFREFMAPPELQLLYGFAPACRGLGLAGEVTRHLCDYAFAELGRDEITACVDLDNHASLRVVERLGMEPTGVSAEGAMRFVVDRQRWSRTLGLTNG